eukprot:CAMPEP_0198303326 /NCGR_PEP_ID=MMETSP1449-20131203/56826_1 /TAXON_ID=420275 /ORGANISM="Attheya septentrionalis, Strain CCMP2084" /LENGTH=61 /DNA_ID=CAMNT_0044005813 /DNA_START=554 /DNA_END=739 /DNA_ORIENTATION=-
MTRGSNSDSLVSAGGIMPGALSPTARKMFPANGNIAPGLPPTTRADEAVLNAHRPHNGFQQ